MARGDYYEQKGYLWRCTSACWLCWIMTSYWCVMIALTAGELRAYNAYCYRRPQLRTRAYRHAYFFDLWVCICMTLDENIVLK